MGDDQQHGAVARGRGAHLPGDRGRPRRRDCGDLANIPKLVAGKLPWHEPPDLQSWREKMGPPASGVPRFYGSVQATAAIASVDGQDDSSR